MEKLTKPRPLAAVAPPVSGRCVRHLRKSVRGVGSQMDVLGRDAELAGIDHWLGMGIAVEGPDPGDPANVLVIEGEPGIGKTTVWGEALRRARLAGWQVLTSSPVPSEAKLPHVGLTDLLRPVPASVLAGIPAPQRRPLEVALLREEAGDGNLEPRAVGTGLMALLDALADAAPLLLAVDDAQWVDPASAGALSFALRRLKRRRVLLLMAVRIEGPSGPGIGAIAALEASLGRQALSRLPVGPLSVASTHQMFRQVLSASFPRPALVRIHRAAAGQPVLRPGDSARGAARRRPWTRPSATGAGRSSRTCAAAVAELPAPPGMSWRQWPRYRGPRPPMSTLTRWLRPRSRVSCRSGPTGWSHSAIRCSGRPCTRRCLRPPAGSCTVNALTAQRARNSGPGTWRWLRTSRTARQRRPLMRPPWRQPAGVRRKQPLN